MTPDRLKQFLALLPPGELVMVPELRKKLRKDTENTRLWLGELVAAGLVEKVDLPRRPATKHVPARRAKTAYRLIWKPISTNMMEDDD